MKAGEGLRGSAVTILPPASCVPYCYSLPLRSRMNALLLLVPFCILPMRPSCLHVCMKATFGGVSAAGFRRACFR